MTGTTTSSASAQGAPALDNLVGCVLGQCAGDALGRPVEGLPAKYCAAYLDRLIAEGGWPDPMEGSLAYGQYTDDSQLMRELLQSFVVREGFDAADYAQRIAAIFVEERIVGRGASTERAAVRLAEGVSWELSGEPAPMAGNGSAMRAGVVGLLAASDDELVAMAVDQGRITHADPRCGAGSVAIAGACARVARDGALDLEDLATLVARVDEGFASHLLALRGGLALAPSEAVGPISTVGGDFPNRWSGISPFVVSSVLWALYSFLRSPDDFLCAMDCAIRVGGDVDTTAAMTGAISGAKLGSEGVPEWIKRRLTDRGSWGREELEDLAARAHRLLVG